MGLSPYSFMVRTVHAHGPARASPDLLGDLGLTNDALAAHHFLDLLHPNDRPIAIAALDSAAPSFEARHRARSDRWLPMSWQARTSGGTVHLLGFPSGEVPIPDPALVSPGTHTSLDQMLEVMARIVESKNPGRLCSILLVDPRTRRVTVGAGPSFPPEYNAAIEGLDMGAMVGSCGTAAFWNVPVVVENIQEDPLWANLRAEARLAGMLACWSQPIRAANGSVLGAMALYDPNPGAPTVHEMDGLEIASRMVGLAVEHERLEAHLRLAGKMEALGVLAGGVAHDFNNLLSVILGNAELLAADLPAPSEARDMLDTIVSASETAAQMCTQMLIYAGRSSVAVEPVECNEIIRDLLKLLGVTLSKKATLRHDLRGELRVMADRSQFRQVIMNLITNAAEAVGHNTGEVSVTTMLRVIPETGDLRFRGARAGDYVEVEVRDTGSGMSPEVAAKIFDPFFSTKATGRGLGLAAVKGIADAHGWQVHVRSTLHEGTTITLLMPHTTQEPTRAPASPPRRFARPGRVLVVDDEPEVLSVMEKALNRAGIEVLCAHDGREAVDLFRDRRDTIDCVILDLNMPRLDGEETFRELKKLNGSVRVLLSSGFTEQAMLDRFAGKGLSGVIQKPIKIAKLLEKLQSVLQGPEGFQAGAAIADE